MKISGSNTVPFPVAQVWDALLDPAVLVRTIPGCERLETTGDNTYAMTVTAGVAAIRGTYDGTCALSDLVEHESLVMRLRGAGAPGTVDATVNVAFEDAGDGATRISYEADAIVGGMVGGVGQRMLTSVSRRMAQEFFGNVASALVEQRAPASVVETPEGERGPVYTAPPRAAAPGVSDDFLKGIAVGAGLVLLGVVVGRWSRRG
jgi:carbon monoxide dehydrogenase subunit G